MADAVQSPVQLPKLRRGFARPSGWTIAAWIVAACVAAPVVTVFSHVFLPKGDIWAHLYETVLGSYVTNSMLMMVLVGIGVLIVGVPAAWMVTLCVFPGRKFFEWALLLPMAMPAYVVAYTYVGLLDYAGPVQTGLRDMLGMPDGLHWIPEIRNLPGAALMLVLVLYPYVYLLALSLIHI